ncbi:serine/threonine-protein kinase RsbT [Bacillus mesophilus]|uniref:Anti-sigma regulatory factor n=1 Tax=Bacillus mesophilus TaxID=1808955 RepID=A0A6M0QC11_9BACI|nr:anti-sigma regulatory factor [Bacillus mesophilus]MBM7663131.1 serine/threonine-protein kinase RsbT [Bacillus mesophilus]NEY73893.1 anti-sigma regulatory factor [Bacillus mesophilus]
MEIQSCVKIISEWDIVAARQMGRDIAKQLGFGTVDQARIATAISEMARNIYLYAQKGSICIEQIHTVDRVGIKVSSIDEGPGITDIRRAMEDGFSSSGGLGAGLPGVRRLMDEFNIDSEVGKGTEIVTIKWLRK